LASPSKVTVTCAVTDAIPTPGRLPHLPITAQENDGAAIEAGAAGAHFAARDGGKPDQIPRTFEPFLRVIKQRSNGVAGLTAGRSPLMSVEERRSTALPLLPRATSLNTRSMNRLYPMLKRSQTSVHFRERKTFEVSRDLAADH